MNSSLLNKMQYKGFDEHGKDIDKVQLVAGNWRVCQDWISREPLVSLDKFSAAKGFIVCSDVPAPPSLEYANAKLYPEFTAFICRGRGAT